jgi:hypothetical protein
MQRSQTPSQVQPNVPAQRSGPVPLDPRHLHLVAGGAPRGGWITTDTTTTTSSSAPRGGW